MTKTPHTPKPEPPVTVSAPEVKKRAYQAPRIEVLCKAAEVVMSPSAGVFESGYGNGFRSP